MSRPEKLRKAVASVIEALEDRRMLTTVVGGGVDRAGNVFTQRYEYVDKAGNVAVVTVGGRTVAELIFARVTTTNNIVLSDLVPPPPPNVTAEGRDLFQVYVAESDSRSFITISQRQTTAPFNLIPFSGSAGTFNVTRNDNGQNLGVTPAGGTGALVLGTKTVAIANIPNSENHPIISRAINGAFGVRPAGLGPRVTAGLQVATGHDFGKFFFGGTVLGQVNVGGSMETFYAGNLWTGDARGTTLSAPLVTGTRRAPNFIIGGNLHSLIVTGAIGTDDSTGGTSAINPDYLTGFDMEIGGIVGSVTAGPAFYGGANVINGKVSDDFGAVIEEAEGTNIATSPNAPASGWSRGLLEGNNFVKNDTFDTPQYLPSYAGSKGRSSVIVDGQITASVRIADYSDYYGLPLLAGQSVDVSLDQVLVAIGGTGTAFLGSLSVGVFDPDGRLIETDHRNTSASLSQDPNVQQIQSLRFTADRPGVYRIAVAVSGDSDYNGAGGEFGTTNIGNAPYRLTINGGGNLGLGGIACDGNVFDAQGNGYGFFVQNGDMGALQSDTDIVSQGLPTQTVVVRKGSFRSMEGGQIGTFANNLFGDGPTLSVPRGNVGLVRSTTGGLVINTYDTALNSIGLGGGTFLGVGEAIGGDYQLVSAATTLIGDFLANRAIGTVRAGDMATTNYANAFFANADSIGDDGIIDLIDCTGDLGTITAGGPAISTGPGGDLRYLHVGGTTFRDRFFGGGQGEETTFNPGEKVTGLFDDSGAAIEIEPFPLVPDPNFIPGGTNNALTGPTITLLTYPVRGSGGQAIVSVQSTGSIRIGGGGGGGTKAHVEVGTVRTTGAGNPVVRDPVTGQLLFSQPTSGTGAVNLDVLFDGSGTVDVYQIEANNPTSIRNQTPGEILNITSAGAASSTIGSLEGYDLGVPTHHTDSYVGGATVVNNVYPFNGQRNAIRANNILNVEASGPIGNIIASHVAAGDDFGQIGNIAANSGDRNVRADFEGIVGPIVAGSNIASVDIGEGMLPAGSGNVGRAGVFASGTVGSITNDNQSGPSDIRGNVVGSLGIGSISLSNGSLIGANVMAVADFAQSRSISNLLTLPSIGGSITNPTFQIGDISLGGNGGIIGTEIAAANIGNIKVSRGFGIFTSEIFTAPAGRIQGINAEGYGIRDSLIGRGATVDSIKASAKPKNVSVLEYSTSVRESENGTFDPFTGQQLSNETDLHYALGTSGRKPRLASITDTGVIENVDARGSRDLNSIFASQIRGTVGLMKLSYGNSIGSLETRGDVAGLTITSGRLKKFLTGGSVAALSATIAGPIDSFHVGQTYDASSVVTAQGPSGNILEFIVDGDLNGDVFSSRKISFLAVGGDVGASSLITAQEIDKQQVRGDVLGTIREG